MIDLTTYRPISFSSCENPYMIRDPHGHLQKVRCGTCPQCRQASRNRTSSLLQQEIKNWKYCIFFTLTYNNKFLPKVHTYRDDSGFLRLVTDTRIKPHLSYFPLFGEYEYRLVDGVYAMQKDTFQLQRIPSIEKWSNTSDFGVLFYRDVQLFKKRFIKNYFNYVKKSNPKVFAKGFPQYKILYCGEYGTKTYRPHYHLLFLFDCAELVQNLATFRDFVFSSWCVRKRIKGFRNRYKVEHFANYRRFTLQGDVLPQGERANFSFVPTTDTSAISSYVSSYVNSFANLPRLLQYKSWSAKTVVPRGKYGSFGSKQDEVQEIMSKVIYLEGRPNVPVHYGDYFQKTFLRFDDNSQSFELATIPYSAGTIRSLFCKPYGYRKVSHSFVQSVFKAVFTNVCRAFQRYKRLGEFYSFYEFLYSSDFRAIVLNELLDSKEYCYYYRIGVLQESFWLFLRNGFRTMYEYKLDVNTYLRYFFFVHDTLLPQCRLCKFYQEQDALIRSNFDITCMYDSLTEAPQSWFNTLPTYRYSSEFLLSNVQRRFKEILFNHFKHHNRGNLA